MARIIIIILIFSLQFLAIKSSGQERILTGAIVTSDSIPLKSASVIIITHQDSLYYSFTRTDNEGKFFIDAPNKNGKYFLIASNSKFADVSFPFDIDSIFKEKNFGIIRLTLNATLLDEVTMVARKRLMNVKGDTLEYNIDQLKLEPNARVEDILRQLPGMQVTRGGQIYSLGKMIEQVLVDGEPFFGNDPTLVTKNIRADIVDKIQVYEDASKKEKMTGISDLNKRKTLNIKLKENKKVGSFGGIELGYLDKQYNTLVLLNKFNGNEKLFGFGLINNTGKIGVGYKTLQSSGGSLGSQFNSSTGNFTGEGVPKVYGAGFGYYNNWNDRHKLSTTMNVNGINTVGTKTSYRQLDANSNATANSDTTNFRRKTNSQGVQLHYEFNGKSTVYIDLNAGASQYENSNQKRSILADIEEKDIIADIEQSRRQSGNNHVTDLSMNWSKKLGKRGRILSFGLSPSYNRSNDKTDLILKYNNNEGQSDSTFYISKKTRGNNIVSTIDYSEPVLGGVLGLAYTNSLYQSDNERLTRMGSELNYDSVYSGNFRHNYTSNRFGTTFQWNKNKFKADLGANLYLEKRNLNDIWRNKIYTNHFTFSKYNANFKYEIRKGNPIRLNYNRTISTPSLELVLPLANIESSPNISNGNINLEPEEKNSFGFEYLNFRVKKMRAYQVTVNMGINNNAVGYNSITNSIGQLISAPVNIPHTTSSYSFSTYFGIEVNPKKDYFVIYSEGNKSLGYSYFNNIENSLNSLLLKLGSSFTFFKRSGIQFDVHATGFYEQMQYSKNQDYNYDGFGFDGSSNLSIFLPMKFAIKQSANFLYKPKMKLLNSSLNQVLWDLSLQKQIGKDSKYTVIFSVNDLLNQNTGFQRFYSSTGFTENRYTAIQRYFLLTFKWDFNKMENKQ